MTRSIDTNTEALSQNTNVVWCLMARLDFASGIVAVNDSPSTISFNGDNYIGVGAMGSISEVEESVDLRPYSISLSLSGIDTGLVSTTLNEIYQGRSALVYAGLMDESHQLVHPPVLLFSGKMDTMDITIGDTAVILLTVQSRLADWDRPRVRRYNNEDQARDYPLDRGFEFIPDLIEREILWGVK